MPKQYEFDIEGHKIAALGYNEQLPGTPAIFIHGITSSIGFFSVGQIPLFAENYRWYSLSLPGHYPAALPENFHPDELTAEMIARVLTKAIRKLVGDQRVILAGHSTGGFAALSIAAHMPELAERVICVSGFAQGIWTGTLGLFQKLVRHGGWLGRTLYKANYTILGRSERLFRMAMDVYVADRQAAHANPYLDTAIDVFYPNVGKIDREAMIVWFQRMPDTDITPLLLRITAPTLVLAGALDPIVPPDQARLIAQHVSGSDLVLLDGVGHLPMLERTQAYYETVTQWMQRVPV